MLFLHETHKVKGKHEDGFEAALRDGWMRELAKGGDARLLYFAHHAHGSGMSYQVVTLTAIRDGAAWERLALRIQKGDLDSRQTPTVLESLSPREVQVLRLVADGKTSKEIAVLLDLREQTVRSYRKTMMKKLGVNNVAGLTHLALSSGLTQVARAQGRS